MESFWDNFRIILGSGWNHFGIILDHFGIMLGSFWDHFGIILGSFLDHFGIIWDHFDMILGSFWGSELPWTPSDAGGRVVGSHQTSQ